MTEHAPHGAAYPLNLTRNDNRDIKRIPQEPQVRAAICERAAMTARGDVNPASFSRADLQALAETILTELELPSCYLGFAMVAVDNALWLDQFNSVPFERRLLLLPKCLASSMACRGHLDSVGLHCSGCGACHIAALKMRAEELGYSLIVAEGTSSVIMKVLEGGADAILGVACLDSLDKSFEHMADLGIPHHSVPLLTDGCCDTTADIDLIERAISCLSDAPHQPHHSYLPLLRAARDLFDPVAFDELLQSPSSAHGDHGGYELCSAGAVARQWMLAGGKRFRPFITLAAYAVAANGAKALSPSVELSGLLPPAVSRIAVAIEAFHKASLVHDDIEDDDDCRYGQPTVHRTYGVGAAINVGDYLVGLGYSLIAQQVDDLGAACVADITAALSEAHLRLCCGQGGELMWNAGETRELRPIDALQIGAMKTAPAFEVAVYAGLRAAGAKVERALLRRYATYVGEAYQVQDDLADWDESADKIGRDVLSGRPTILRAFAAEAGGDERLCQLMAAEHPSEAWIPAVRECYHELGAFERAEVLYARLRDRALEAASAFEADGGPELCQLMRFLARNTLRERRRYTEADEM